MPRNEVVRMAILEMTDEEYRVLEGVNASTLKSFIHSVKEGNKSLEKPFKGSPATAFGTLCHSYVLEADTFEDEYALFSPPVNEKTGKPYSAYTKTYENELKSLQEGGKTALTQEQYDKLKAIEQSIEMCEDTTKILGKCDKRELVLTWTDKRTGLKCKAKLDAVGDKISLDLKTIGDFKHHGYDEDSERLRNTKLHYQCLDYGYYLQFKHYLNGCIANNLNTEMFAVIWVERDGINDVCTTFISDEKLELGQKQLDSAFDNFVNRKKDCKLYHKISEL